MTIVAVFVRLFGTVDVANSPMPSGPAPSLPSYWQLAGLLSFFARLLWSPHGHCVPPLIPFSADSSVLQKAISEFCIFLLAAV